MILANTKTFGLKIAVMALSLAFVSMPQRALAQEEDSSREAHRAAFEACAASLGIEVPEPGQRPQAPDEEVRAKLDACMKEKGFEPPKHRAGEGGHRPRGGGSSIGVQ